MWTPALSTKEIWTPRHYLQVIWTRLAKSDLHLLHRIRPQRIESQLDEEFPAAPAPPANSHELPVLWVAKFKCRDSNTRKRRRGSCKSELYRPDRSKVKCSGVATSQIFDTITIWTHTKVSKCVVVVATTSAGKSLVTQWHKRPQFCRCRLSHCRRRHWICYCSCFCSNCLVFH